MFKHLPRRGPKQRRLKDEFIFIAEPFTLSNGLLKSRYSITNGHSTYSPLKYAECRLFHSAVLKRRGEKCTEMSNARR